MDTDLEGLPLAEHHFGPLLSPIAATKAQWTAYANHRLKTNEMFGDVFLPGTEEDEDEDEIKEGIIGTLSGIEGQMGLQPGTLSKCVSILSKDVLMEDVGDPRTADIHSRIYSPTAPMYIDVHLKYHCRSRYYEVEWFYSIGYKIHRRPLPPNSNDRPYTSFQTYNLSGPPSNWHTRNGWQPICWGFYDDTDGDFGRHWRRIEQGATELHHDAVLDIHEALFGNIQVPSSDDPGPALAYRKRLVLAVRVLLASVGIDYDIACTDEEENTPPHDFMLEGLADKWVARGVRKACGFQLNRDPEEEKKGQKDREEEAKGDEDEDEDGYGSEDDYYY